MLADLSADAGNLDRILEAQKHALAGALFGLDLNLTRVLSWLFAPLAFVLGLPSGDVSKVATLLGQKTVFNEFVAYSHLSEMLKADPQWLSPRGRIIASYALCGFANIASVGITSAGFGILAPTRRPEILALVWKALLVGFLATCMTAASSAAMDSLRKTSCK